MNITISPSKLTGSVAAIPSKSVAHRALICAALAEMGGGGAAAVEVAEAGVCSECKDITATRDCLKALRNGKAGLLAKSLKVGESGSTLRFLLPIVGALGCGAEFRLEGRLAQRPLSPLYEELVKHGCTLSPQGSNPLRIKGQLHAGHYIIDAGVSSQFISGLLFALPLLKDISTIRLWGNIESASYIDLTVDMLEKFGIKTDFDGACFVIPGNQIYTAPTGGVKVEGDWSNAAFWLAAGVEVTGLNPDSRQGDRAIVEILKQLGGGSDTEIDASDIPDLVPIIAVAATQINAVTHIVNAERLRIKESDRLAAITEVLGAIGADISETDDGLTIRGGKPLKGGVTVSSHNDHRIAMSAAIAATMCEQPVTISGAEAVEKSYPTFWEDLKQLTK
jgi:3-phosphoshikimate 1-carboxyvinyltransferase